MPTARSSPPPPPPSAPWSGALARAVDAGLELSVAGSFSAVGCRVRRRLDGWRPPPPCPGRTVLVTGASSGIGRATAVGLGRLGADLWLVGRDLERTAQAAGAARRAGAPRAEVVLADLADPDQVEALAARVGAGPLHGLVHAAGALSPTWRAGPDGTELTVATGLLGPFRLTWRLAGALRAAAPAVVVTVSSGGMYSQRMDTGGLESAADGYRGARAYARVKRAQVVLARAWAHRLGPEVASVAMHPGWVDTPGLATGLPSFTHLGPLLRRPEEGADTVVWLVARGLERAPGRRLDGFWHDRRRRSEHRVPWTRPADGQRAEEDRLWAWCQDRTGLR